MSFLIGVWFLFASLVFIAETEEILWYRFRIGMVPAILLTPTIFWFVIYLTDSCLGLWLTVLIYVISIPLHYINWSSVLLFDRAMGASMTWRLHPDFGSFWMYYWLVYNGAMILSSLYLLYRWRKKVRSFRVKRQAETIFILLLVFVFAGMLGDYVVLPLLNFPLLGPVYFVIFLIGTYYAIVRFRFFSITHMTINREVLQHIDMVIILLDEVGNITLVNKAAETSLNIENVPNFLGKNITAIFEDSDTLKRGITRLLKRGIKSFSCLLRTKLDGVNKTFSVNVSLVKDRYGVVGILLVGSEILGIKDFMNRYHISVREWETIQYLLFGVSNRLIARYMKISECTVKAHITHIYNKLEIANRVQLLNILKRFGILPPPGREYTGKINIPYLKRLSPYNCKL